MPLFLENLYGELDIIEILQKNGCFFVVLLLIIRKCKICLIPSKHSSSFASSCPYLYLLLVCVFCLVQLYQGSLCQKITFRDLIYQKVYIWLFIRLPMCLHSFQILVSHFLKPLTTPPIPLIWGNVCYCAAGTLFMVQKF